MLLSASDPSRLKVEGHGAQACMLGIHVRRYHYRLQMVGHSHGIGKLKCKHMSLRRSDLAEYDALPARRSRRPERKGRGRSLAVQSERLGLL